MLFPRREIKSPILLGMTIATLMALIILGGAPNVPGWQTSVMMVFSAALIASAFYFGSFAEFSKLGLLQKTFPFSLILVPLIQVIPLPPSIWQSFPGRSLENEIFQLVGAADQWHSISLNPAETLFVLATLTPAAAIFLAILKLNIVERRIVASVVILLALISIIIGLFQFSTGGETFNFYNSSHKQFLLGFFANRNHQGLYIASALALTISLTFRLSENRTIALTFSGLVTFFFVGAAIATTSRAGLSFAILAAFLTVLINMWSNDKSGRIIAILAVSAIVFFLLFQSIGAVFGNVLERYSTISDDARWDIWVQSGTIIQNYFPWGSGLGTFVPVYQQSEPLEFIQPTFVNHIHNDYYELILETGIGGIAILTLFVATLGQAIVKSQLSKLSGTKAAAFVIVLMVALHSIVDYPLRTQAMAAVFAFCLAVIFRPKSKKT